MALSMTNSVTMVFGQGGMSRRLHTVLYKGTFN